MEFLFYYYSFFFFCTMEELMKGGGFGARSAFHYSRSIYYCEEHFFFNILFLLFFFILFFKYFIYDIHYVSLWEKISFLLLLSAGLIKFFLETNCDLSKLFYREDCGNFFDFYDLSDYHYGEKVFLVNLFFLVCRHFF